VYQSRFNTPKPSFQKPAIRNPWYRVPKSL
jgi:hypothetical protein